MRISDWSSDVCSSDLVGAEHFLGHHGARVEPAAVEPQRLRIGDVGAEARSLRVRQIVGDRRLPGHAAPHRGKAGIDEAVHLVSPGRRRSAARQRMPMIVWVSCDAPSIALAFAWKLSYADLSTPSSSVIFHFVLYI